MTAVRQSTALAICLWGMDFLIEKKYIKFIFSILIASLFHKTALIFISAVLLINRKIKAYPFAFVIIALILSKYSSSLIFNLINKLFVEQRAEYYLKNSNSLNYTLLLVNSVILLVTYFIYKQNNEEDFFFNKSYYLVLLGICFLPFCTIIAEFFRISMYFMVYIIIILPNAIHKLKNKNSKFIYELSLVIIMIIYMIISNGNNYGVFPYNFL